VSRSLVLDAGALIAVERRSPAIQALVVRARQRGLNLVVPTAVVAQVVRGGGRQVNLRRFLADPALRFVGLDYPTALRIGSLLGESGTADVVDAAVVVCARELGMAPVATSDPSDLRKLDPALPLISI
jgi:predicted nucleic acid-binding protein